MVACPYCHNKVSGYRLAFECRIYYSTQDNELFFDGWSDMSVNLPLLSNLDNKDNLAADTEKKCTAMARCNCCHKSSYALIEPYTNENVFTTKKYMITKLFETREERDKARFKLSMLKTLEV